MTEDTAGPAPGGEHPGSTAGGVPAGDRPDSGAPTGAEAPGGPTGAAHPGRPAVPEPREQQDAAGDVAAAAGTRAATSTAGDPATNPYGVPPMPGVQSGTGPAAQTTPPVPGPEQPCLPAYRPAAAEPRRRGRVGTAVIALIAGLIGGLAAGNLTGSGHGTSTTGGGSPNALDTAAPPAAQPVLPTGSVAQVAQKLLPSVAQLQFSGPSGNGEGSGIVLSGDGMILTNNHVVSAGARGAKLEAQFQDGRSAPVRIVGRAPAADLAVVQADHVDGLTPAELGSSGTLVVGQQVVAIGSPFQLTGTVTSGIVSALQRPARVGGDSGDQSTVLDTVQTDAAINPGNSGGPLVDMQGRVIAINSAIYSPDQGGLGVGPQGGSVGVGFAIPIDQARRIADQLRTNGHATLAVLGVAVRPSGPAQVVTVTPGSPGDHAGMKAGDVVTKVGDRRVQDSDGLIAAVRSHNPGETVKVVVTNGADGSVHTVDVVLGSEDVGTTN